MTDALIVIDMQQGSFGPESRRHDAAGLLERLSRLARAIRTDGGAVIFIQHDGPPGLPLHSIAGEHAADLDAVADAARAGTFRAEVTLVTVVAQTR